MNHKCPFLSHGKYCDFKKFSFHSKEKSVCIYNNCEKCPDYQRSETKLKIKGDINENPN